MKKFPIFILILLFAGTTAAQTGFTPIAAVDEFKKQLNETSGALISLESNFTQTKYLDILDEKVISEGKFFYKKDSRICLDYSVPTAYRVVINKKKIKITSGGKTTIYDVGKNKLLAQTNVLMTACMTGNLNDLTREYELTFKESSTQYCILVTPLAKSKSYIRSMELFLDKKDFSVQQIKMIEPSNDYTIYAFSGKKKNVPISDDKFNIEEQ